MKRTNKWHLLMWTHPCHWGVQCRGFQRFISGAGTDWDVQHVECSVHLAREVCPDGRKCQMTWDPEHMNEFTHPGIRDYRHRCDSGPMCENFASEHRLEFYHPPAFQPVSPVIGVNSEVDYERNYRDLYHDVQFWLRLHMGIDPHGDDVVPPAAIVEYCHEIRPIHRCKLGVFKLVLSQECLISRQFMIEMAKNRRQACITELLTCPGILRVLHKHGLFTLEKNIHSLLVAVVEEVISEKPRENLRLVRTQILSEMSAKFRPALDEVEKVARKVATQVKSLSLQGIGHHVDRDLGTHKQVFSVVGNHTFSHYGNVFLVLKRDIMFHPDFDLTANAGTSFPSGKVFFDACRPWAACRGREDDVRPAILDRVRQLARANLHRDPGWQQQAYSSSIAEMDRIDLYHRSKMHYCLGEKVYELMALELMAKWMYFNRSKRIPTRQEIWDLLAHLDAHFNFEGHLPSVVPLSYVEKVVISRRDYANLSDVEKGVLERTGIEVNVSPRTGSRGSKVLKFANKHNLLVYPDSPPLALTGLCFSAVMSLGKDDPVFNLQTAGLDGSVTVEFLARGPDIHVGFCTGFNATFCTAHPNFHVVINAQYSYFDEPLSAPTTLVSRGHDRDAKKMTVMKSMKWFDHRVLPGEMDTGGDFVHYRIEYVYHRDSAVLKVGHGEKSPDLLDKELTVDIPNSPVAVFCVTFGAWMHAVEFRDARIML